MYLTQGLHRAAQQEPDAVATVCAGRTRTNTESVDRIARLAAASAGSGCGRATARPSSRSTPTASTSSSPPRCGPAASSSR